MGWGGIWEGGSRGRGHIYIYLWLIRVDIWQKPKNSAKQLFNLKINTLKKNVPEHSVLLNKDFPEEKLSDQSLKCWGFIRV